MARRNEQSDIHSHHGDLLGGLYDQMRTVFESSEQPMYLYLDDTHKTCNKKFASLLGYGTPQEWARVEEFSDLVAEKSMKDLVTAYQDAMTRMIGSTIEVTWRTKSGGTVDTAVILVPVAYDEHLFALHFVSPKA
jgi:PAS domain-containing protein